MIEDEYLVAEEIRFYLNRAGFAEIEHAATEDKALKRIADAAWDAAIVDANLNGRGMGAVADSLFKHRIPFVIVTGYGRESLPERVADVPIVDKPFRPKTLVDAVSKLFSK